MKAPSVDPRRPLTQRFLGTVERVGNTLPHPATIAGAPSGVGSTYEWSGNSDVGSGKMEITNSTPSSNVTIKLDFNEPFESHNTTVFALVPSASGTDVTWTMSGPNNYMSKVMSVFMSMDKMIGGDFEKGLSQLKTVSEK